MTAHEDDTIRSAIAILESRLRKPGVQLSGPSATSQFLISHLATREQEVFAVIFLDAKHRMIEYREMFYGTIDGASVYPREILKAALQLNASAVILSHNHPSGSTEPSAADITVTDRVNQALKLVDIRLLDHIIVGGIETTSLAERGLV